jgi:hypothetical protein
MKFTFDRPYSDPEKAARKLIEIANSVEAVQDGRIYIELINWPFLNEATGSPDEYLAGLKLAIDRGWLWLRESGTYVKLIQADAELFAHVGTSSSFGRKFAVLRRTPGVTHASKRQLLCLVQDP